MSTAKNTLKQELETGGIRVLNAARNELYIDMRFMGAALSSLSFEMDLSTTSVGTDAVAIRFNPSYVIRLFVEEPGKLNRTYVHMLLHCIFRHMYLSERFDDERLFDLCADIVVESILDGFDYQSISRVTSDLRDKWYERLSSDLRVLTVEKLYRYFSLGSLLDDELLYERLEREFALDDHSFWLRLSDQDSDDKKDDKKDKPAPPDPDDMDAPSDNTGNKGDREKDNNSNKPSQGTSASGDENKKREKYINPRRLKAMRDREKDWDKESKRLETEIETIGTEKSDRLGMLSWILKLQNTSRTDYKEFLSRFRIISEESGIDMDTFDPAMYTFGLEHYGNMPLIEENEFREVKKIKELVIAIDTSASCKDEQVQRFLDETAAMLFTSDSFFQKTRICIIECDDQVQRIETINSADDMKTYAEGIHVEGGFGTDFRPVFDKVDELLRTKYFENLKGLVYFTDGYGEYPERPTSYDTAFVFLKDEDYNDEKVPSWALKLYV